MQAGRQPTRSAQATLWWLTVTVRLWLQLATRTTRWLERLFNLRPLPGVSMFFCWQHSLLFMACLVLLVFFLLVPTSLIVFLGILYFADETHTNGLLGAASALPSGADVAYRVFEYPLSFFC